MIVASQDRDPKIRLLHTAQRRCHSVRWSLRAFCQKAYGFAVRTEDCGHIILRSGVFALCELSALLLQRLEQSAVDYLKLPKLLLVY